MSILNAIISRQLAGSSCSRILASDGITEPDLTIKAIPGIFGAISIDARSARKSVPAIGEASSAAKNLDEYQFKICSLVPSLADSSPSKMLLQKYRVIIIAAFAKLMLLLQKIRQDDLALWSRHARTLLEETSEAYTQAQINSKLQIASHKEVLEYFEIPEEKIVAALKTFYGM
jgi:hypothetical protein